MPRTPKRTDRNQMTTAERLRVERAEKNAFTPFARRRMETYKANAYTENIAVGIVQPSAMSPIHKRAIVVYGVTDAYVFNMGYYSFMYDEHKNSWRFRPTNAQRTSFYNDKKPVIAVYEYTAFHKNYEKWCKYIIERDVNRENAPTLGEFLEAVLIHGMDNVNSWRPNVDAFTKTADGVVNGTEYQIAYEGKTWATENFLSVLSK